MVYYNNSFEHSGILGMKWGVRRYENKDGTLTEAGKKRYAKELKKNSRKKKENRLSEEALKDPNKWVTEDIENTRSVTNEAANLARNAENLERSIPKKKAGSKMDLSKMSDSEMRARINRAILEKQYSDLFSEPPKKKARDYIRESLQIGGGIMATASSALGIALAIRRLKNN